MTAAAQTSSKRTEANLRNSLKSTGPRTMAGKERAKFNALKHGLRAKVVVLPGEDRAEYERRLDGWIETVRPRNAGELDLVRRVVDLTWQLDRLGHTEVAVLQAGSARTRAASRREIQRAGVDLFAVPAGLLHVYPDWFEGLELDGAEPLQAGSPRLPAAALRELEATADGCTWMLDRWAALRQRLEQGKTWRSTDRLRAIRLLGEQPYNAIHDDRVCAIYRACRAMDPTGAETFADPLAELRLPSEKKDYREKLAARTAAIPEPADPEAGRAVLLEIVAEAVARLKVRRAEHAATDPPAAAILAAGFDEWDRKMLEQTRRHQVRFSQALCRALEALRKVRKEFGEHEPDEHEPDDGPAPVVDSGDLSSSESAPIAIEPIAVMAAAAPAATNEANTTAAVADLPTQDDDPRSATNEAIATEVVPEPVVKPTPPRGATNEAIATEAVPEPVVPAVEPQAATNEANGLVARGGGLIGAVLALVALLVLAGISAAFAAGTAVARMSPPVPLSQGSGPQIPGSERTEAQEAGPECRWRSAGTTARRQNEWDERRQNGDRTIRRTAMTARTRVRARSR
jgi:hypothetical protein